MDREKAKSLALVMMAYAEGKEIQTKNMQYGGWSEVENPCFIFKTNEYRIKPEEPDFIDWSHVADKWKFLARDADGRAYLYTDKPVLRSNDWFCRGACEAITVEMFASYKGSPCAWTGSLNKRPEPA